jgi:hypothetical protein
MLIVVNQVGLSLFKPSCHLFPPVLTEFDKDSPLLFPHTLRLVAAAQRIDEAAMEFSRRPSGVLGIRNPQPTFLWSGVQLQV